MKLLLYTFLNLSLGEGELSASHLVALYRVLTAHHTKKIQFQDSVYRNIHMN
jgi:hypothetical protein